MVRRRQAGSEVTANFKGKPSSGICVKALKPTLIFDAFPGEETPA